MLNLQEPLSTLLNVESLISLLKSTSDPLKKREIWQDLKWMCISRIMASTYLISLHVIFNYLQITILGRLFYISSLNQENKLLDEIREQKFLAFSWHLLNVGLAELVEKISSSSKLVMEQIPLNENITLDILHDMVPFDSVF